MPWIPCVPNTCLVHIHRFEQIHDFLFLNSFSPFQVVSHLAPWWHLTLVSPYFHDHVLSWVAFQFQTTSYFPLSASFLLLTLKYWSSWYCPCYFTLHFPHFSRQPYAHSGLQQPSRRWKFSNMYFQLLAVLLPPEWSSQPGCQHIHFSSQTAPLPNWLLFLGQKLRNDWIPFFHPFPASRRSSKTISVLSLFSSLIALPYNFLLVLFH